MRIQKLNRDDAEVVDVAFTNVRGATLTLGHAVGVCGLAASLSGNNAVSPTEANPFQGISLSDVPVNGVGMARAYGVVSSVFVFAVGSSVTVNAGDVMGPGAAASLGVNSTGVRTVLAPVYAATAAGAAICSPGGYVKGFVRAL
jgi:hypothetical protein